MCMYCRREACRDDLLRGRTRCPGGQGGKGPRQRVDGTKMRGSARHRATLIDHAPPWHRGRMISRPLDGSGGLWGIPVHHQGTRTSHQTPSPPKQGTNGWTGGGGGGRGRPVSSPLVRAAVGQSNVHVPFLLCPVFQLFLLPRTSTLPFDSAAVDVLLLLFVARGNLIPILALLPFSPI